jgi:hypothetical protein
MSHWGYMKTIFVQNLVILYTCKQYTPIDTKEAGFLFFGFEFEYKLSNCTVYCPPRYKSILNCLTRQISMSGCAR